MKIILITIFALSTFSQEKCTRIKKPPSDCLKGRLEVKGICSNYTIKLLEGDIDTTKIVASWQDEVTGRTYTNVFALGSPCTFPETIKEGEEFYFMLDDSKQHCAVCMAYYPKPKRALSIKILEKTCN